ncbi:hypothetical protein [Haladaptatus sp. NG-SE-30]
MTLAFEVSNRFLEAATEWGDRRLMDDEQAFETKAEQALLEIEHLVSGATEVEFAIDGRTVRHEPSEQLRSYLTEQATDTGLSEAEVLGLHVDLFARAFRQDDATRPPNAPPE